jgi:hypothetical protein
VYRTKYNKNIHDIIDDFDLNLAHKRILHSDVNIDKNSKYNFKVNHALSNKKKQLLSHFLTLNVFNSINLSECTGSHKV